MFSRRAVAWAWRAVLATLHFLSLLEDLEAGQPRRLSQVRCMIWGAMVVGVLLVGKVQLTGEPVTLTEGGFASLLTIVAGLMKFNRDRQDKDGGLGRWDGGGYGGGYRTIEAANEEMSFFKDEQDKTQWSEVEMVYLLEPLDQWERWEAGENA